MPRDKAFPAASRPPPPPPPVLNLLRGQQSPLNCMLRSAPPGQHPVRFTHPSMRCAGDALLAEPAAQEMLTYSDQETEFGIRVKVIPYPEGVVSAWAMLCVKHPA